MKFGHSYHDRDSDRVPVSSTSAEAIMRTAAFAAGVNDVRTGQAPRYDDFMFNQDEGDAAARAFKVAL